MVDIEGGGEVYYIGSTALTTAEVAGLRECEREQFEADSQIIAECERRRRRR